jgi:hypothetical protein
MVAANGERARAVPLRSQRTDADRYTNAIICHCHGAGVYSATNQTWATACGNSATHPDRDAGVKRRLDSGIHRIPQPARVRGRDASCHFASGTGARVRSSAPVELLRNCLPHRVPPLLPGARLWASRSRIPALRRISPGRVGLLPALRPAPTLVEQAQRPTATTAVDPARVRTARAGCGGREEQLSRPTPAERPTSLPGRRPFRHSPPRVPESAESPNIRGDRRSHRRPSRSRTTCNPRLQCDARAWIAPRRSPVRVRLAPLGESLHVADFCSRRIDADRRGSRSISGTSA